MNKEKIRTKIRELRKKQHFVYDGFGPSAQGELQAIEKQIKRLEQQLTELE